MTGDWGEMDADASAVEVKLAAEVELPSAGPAFGNDAWARAMILR